MLWCSLVGTGPENLLSMMASSNWNICRVTGYLCGEFTGHRWIPCTKASEGHNAIAPIMTSRKWISRVITAWGPFQYPIRRLITRHTRRNLASKRPYRFGNKQMLFMVKYKLCTSCSIYEATFCKCHFKMYSLEFVQIIMSRNIGSGNNLEPDRHNTINWIIDGLLLGRICGSPDFKELIITNHHPHRFSQQYWLFNSLWHSDAIWRHRSGSTLAKDWHQWWISISKVQRQQSGIPQPSITKVNLLNYCIYKNFIPIFQGQLVDGTALNITTHSGVEFSLLSVRIN